MATTKRKKIGIVYPIKPYGAEVGCDLPNRQDEFEDVTFLVSGTSDARAAIKRVRAFIEAIREEAVKP